MALGSRATVSIPVGREIFDIEGKVAYSNRVTNIDFYKTGIQFEDASNAFRAKLVEQMLQIKEYRDQRSRELGYELSEEAAARLWIEKYAKHFSQLF